MGGLHILHLLDSSSSDLLEPILHHGCSVVRKAFRRMSKGGTLLRVVGLSRLEAMLIQLVHLADLTSGAFGLSLRPLCELSAAF